MLLFRSPTFAIGVTSFCGILFALLLPATSPLLAVGLLSFLFPVLMVWMAISVLRHRASAPPPLQRGEEWGYSDAPGIRPASEG